MDNPAKQSTKLLYGNILQVSRVNDELAIHLNRQQGIAIDSKGVIQKIAPKDKFKDWVAEEVIDYGNAFILPGFIDSHVHFPQIDLIGVYSGELLSWLTEHTFPHEIKIIEDQAFAKSAAHRFCNELYSNGTTTAVAFACSHQPPTDTLFEAFAKTGGRLISGKISMNQHAPEAMLDPVESDLRSQGQLIKKWHGYQDRLYYALSPRFAPSCSSELLTELGALNQASDDLFVQTHYAENLDELAWVKSLYPNSKDYLDVYDSFGLLGERTILAHCIHTSSSEKKRLADNKVVLSHCPSSNMFLGSGLFGWHDHDAYNCQITLGTDVGAGTSFSMWKTMGDGVKVSKLRQQQVKPETLLYSATLGAAQALGWGDRIGSIEVGKQADLQVVNPEHYDLLAKRLEHCEDPQQVLSALMFLCDDRCHEATFVLGRKVWSR